MWMADTPGDKLCFSFKGTECLVYDLLGPDCGQVWVTVDGKRGKAPIGRFDSYCTYYRLAGFRVFKGAEGVHKVEIEVDVNQPNRKVLLQRHPKEDLTQKKYDGTKLFACQIELVGDLVD